MDDDGPALSAIHALHQTSRIEAGSVLTASSTKAQEKARDCSQPNALLDYNTRLFSSTAFTAARAAPVWQSAMTASDVPTKLGSKV